VRAGVIDIGSNSVLLLAVETGGAGWREIAGGERITRLAAGLANGRRLDAAACRRTLGAVVAFCARARAVGVEHLWAVGTRPFRLAEDGPAFAARIVDATGVAVEILSEAREAELTFAAAVAGLQRTRGAVLSVDIGGGSTEIVFGRDGQPLDRASLPVGALVLTERHLCSDPPAPAEVAALRAAVSAEVAAASPIGRRAAADDTSAIVGSGGTLTTLAAIRAGLTRYRADVVHGSRLDRDELQALAADLARRSLAERQRLPGLPPGRALTIAAGALIADAIVTAAAAPAIVVSDHGLRHGVLRERLGAQCGGPGRSADAAPGAAGSTTPPARRADTKRSS
jgi:exopolyphosphatase/guanosine-5'-triphosphate,3'-diphosphate pyrophosphatase